MPVQYYSNLSSKSGQGSVITSDDDGALYMPLDNIPCKSVTIINATGLSLDCSKDNGDTLIKLPNGASFTFSNIVNANSVSVRRSDLDVPYVIVYYNWCN